MNLEQMVRERMGLTRPATDADQKTEETPTRDNSEEHKRLFEQIARPYLTADNLSEKDEKIVAFLLHNLFEGRKDSKTINILKTICSDKSEYFQEIERLSELISKGIVEHFGHFEEDEEPGPVEILNASIGLSKSFLLRICNAPVRDKDTPAESPLAEPYRNNLEYLADQFERIRLMLEAKGMQDMFRRRRLRRVRSCAEPTHMHLGSLETHIERRLSAGSRSFPFEKFKKQHRLTANEGLVIIALLRAEVMGNEAATTEDLMDLINETPYERLVNKDIFSKKGRLIKKKMIEINKMNSIFHEPIGAVLNRNVKARLLGEKAYSKRIDLKDGFFEVIGPSVSLEDVVLPQRTRQRIDFALKAVANKNNACPVSIPSRKKTGKSAVSMTMLFYGAPGTGKTLAANAIAHKLRTKLITIDCSKILGKFVGESEKNTRRIFDQYRELAKGKKTPPVLLLNEADQFLHRRISASRSTDHMYNQMQNIFLEQLERFEGVLIATTNLPDNLDTAFSRRFIQKIEFQRPGPAERLKLWSLHMPAGKMLSDDIDLCRIAESYDLSGGQITVVLKNAVGLASMRDGKLTQEDIITACEDETAGNFDASSARKIGFGR